MKLLITHVRFLVMLAISTHIRMYNVYLFSLSIKQLGLACPFPLKAGSILVLKRVTHATSNLTYLLVNDYNLSPWLLRSTHVLGYNLFYIFCIKFFNMYM